LNVGSDSSKINGEGIEVEFEGEKRTGENPKLSVFLIYSMQ
jgi:hypothetical protein